MQVNLFHFVQAAVEVLLKKDVPEAIAGQELAVRALDALSTYQTMLPI